MFMHIRIFSTDSLSIQDLTARTENHDSIQGLVFALKSLSFHYCVVLD